MKKILSLLQSSMAQSHKNRESGSGLLVTIMITSTVLLVAIVLLENIIPFARSIQPLTGSLQSYYTAKGQLEQGIQAFQRQGSRKDIDLSGTVLRKDFPSIGITTINSRTIPLNEGNRGDYVILSNSKILPLTFQFANDDSFYTFGTYKKDKTYYTMNTVGGITIDLTQIDVQNRRIALQTSQSITNGTISVEGIKYRLSEGGQAEGFVGGNEQDVLTDTFPVTDIQNMSNIKLSDYFLISPLCNETNVECFLNLTGTNFAPADVGVQITSEEEIPDLNAIIIAEGVSADGKYHSRLIDLIPTIQGI